MKIIPHLISVDDETIMKPSQGGYLTFDIKSSATVKPR